MDFLLYNNLKTCLIVCQILPTFIIFFSFIIMKMYTLRFSVIIQCAPAKIVKMLYDYRHIFNQFAKKNKMFDTMTLTRHNHLFLVLPFTDLSDDSMCLQSLKKIMPISFYCKNYFVICFILKACTTNKSNKMDM